VALRDSIVVAGAHGKTTTSAMIAYVLQQLGRDPAYAIGGSVPQLGGNARAGAGWFVVEGDESDRTVAALRPQIAVVLNVELDHHAEFGSLAELCGLFEEWVAHVPHVVRAEELEPLDGGLAVRGDHNRRNAAAAVAALELAGVSRDESLPVLKEFRGVGRRFDHRGTANDVDVYDDYAHHPAEVAATIRAARELGRGRVLVLFQPHLFSRTLHLAREFGAALACADAVAIADVYPAREQPLDGVSGKLIVDAVADARPGARVAWSPDAEFGARWLAALARRGDVVLTVGAGDVDACAPLVLESLG
jgi:UDP-N-acetylmuramate--alanine ligase